jgi:hypothetical protein
MNKTAKKESNRNTEDKSTLPPHLLAALKKYEERKVKYVSTITDVTPKGYGPND